MNRLRTWFRRPELTPIEEAADLFAADLRAEWKKAQR
jgi:hypothetical protein